jgi:hyaluronoglucosaminidase
VKSPFEIRGVVEGFYGVYYTVPQRERLIRFIGDLDFNTYIYGPKDDREHRVRWRELYPEETMQRFAHTVQVARQSGVRFVYALSCGLSICYSSEEDLAHIQKKFLAFHRIGVRDFSLFLDDISHEFPHDEDRRVFSSYAQAHAAICNRVLEWLRSVDTECTLSMCPTDYCGEAPFSAYLHELGAGLDPRIDIFYTGPQVCSTRITTDHVLRFAEAVKRQPIIWDNYPVNDSSMRPELHIGPIKGRSEDLFKGCKGIVSNPMNQAEASKIALATYADYFARPGDYAPEESWESAIQRVAGESSAPHVRLLAETSLMSCLQREAAPKMASLAERLLNSQREGLKVKDNPAASELSDYLTQLDEACYHIVNRMENFELRNDLLPWIEVLENWISAGRGVLKVLELLERGLDYSSALRTVKDALDAVSKHPKRITGGALSPLVDYCMKL